MGSGLGISGKNRSFVWTLSGEVEAQGYRKASQIAISCLGYGLGVCKPSM